MFKNCLYLDHASNYTVQLGHTHSRFACQPRPRSTCGLSPPPPSRKSLKWAFFMYQDSNKDVIYLCRGLRARAFEAESEKVRLQVVATFY